MNILSNHKSERRAKKKGPSHQTEDALDKTIENQICKVALTFKVVANESSLSATSF